MYELVRFSHILGAVIAVGPAVTYGVWLALARREGRSQEAFAFRGVLWIDSHLVTPAFGWQLVSGLLLVFVFNRADIGELWLVTSLVLYGVVAVIGGAVVGPRARAAREALESAGEEAPAYLSYRALMRRLSPLISSATIAILALMVFRPR